MSRIHSARQRVELDENTLQTVDTELEGLREGQAIGPVPVSPWASAVKCKLLVTE